MAPAPDVAGERAADAAHGASAGFLKWVEDHKGVILGAAVGVSAAGLGYYLLSSKGGPGDDSSTGEKGKKRRSKKRSKGTSAEDDPLQNPNGPLVQEASDEDIMKLSAEEIARLPTDSESQSRRTKLAGVLKTAGNKAYKNGKLDEAISLYTKAIAAEPTAVFYCNRAACYTGQRKYREVIEDTNKALELDPGYVKALNRRAVAAEKLAGDGGSGKLEDEKFQLLVRSAEDYTAVAILSQFAANAQQNVEKVLEKLARARAGELMRSRDSKLPSTTFISAYLDAFRKHPAPELPESPSPGDKAFAEALEALDAKEYQASRDAVHKALELGLSTDNLKAHALNLRATFTFISGQTNEAMADLDESTNLDPNYVQSWVKKASLHMELSDKEQAMADFDSAIAANPNDPDIYYHRGQVHFILLDFDAALQDYAKSTELDDTFIFSQVQHAVAQYKLGRVAESTAAFSKILEKFPESSEAYNYYGELQLDQQKYEHAQRNFDRAIAIEEGKPNKGRNALPMINKALLLFQWKSDLKGAEALCRQALEIDSECDVAVSTLAQLCMQQGKIEECIEWFGRAAQYARTEPELVNALSYEYAARSQAAFIKNFPEQGAQLAKLAVEAEAVAAAQAQAGRQ